MKHGETLVAEMSGGMVCKTVSNLEGNINLLSHTHCEMKIRRNIERYMNRVDKDVMKHLLFYNTDTMTYRTFCDSKTQ